ncbi:undecaprenyl/decaprenyl-phosphate alpha-N-acetylglucosaminyl 1-phosphate transferase [Candidatus Dependentiae bacterium]|nr:undecaprenyl/decaprenyl-phosphate alpha-N-acetylglucosaminyl 1-phosphate transferase [Candidatus Dependentiae bacterium]
MSLFNIFFFYGLAFILTVLSVPVFRNYALKRGIVDNPDNNLKRQKSPVPYLGGLSIFVPVFICSILVLLKSILNIDSELNFSFNQLVIIIQILLCATIMMILGLIDDIKNLSPYPKLIVQFLVAIVITRFGIIIQIKFFPYWVNYFLTVMWIVSMTNASNLIDIMDGLCSGVISIACLTFIICGVITGNSVVLMFGSILGGATLGFLIYNYAPAKIYLGDAGSLMIGFIMSALAVSMSYTGNNILALLSPVIILGIPLYDTFLIVYFRIKAGKSPIRGSNDHFALRLNSLGFSVKESVNLIYLISLVISISSILIIKSTFYQALTIYTILFLCSIIFGLMLNKIIPPPEKKH